MRMTCAWTVAPGTSIRQLCAATSPEGAHGTTTAASATGAGVGAASKSSSEKSDMVANPDRPVAF